MKRIAVLSDIHGNILALEKVVEDLEQKDVDVVINLGDHVSGPLWPKETIEFLRQQEWVQILGNHDRRLVHENPARHSPSDLFASRRLSVADLDWLRGLPARTEIGEAILAFHGSPADDLAYLLETVENGRARLATPREIEARLGKLTTPILLCGHSHIPRIVETPPGHLIVNPGSVGLPAYDDEEPEPHIMETGSPHARYALLENRSGPWTIEWVAVSYDHRRAAGQARKNGRDDWATGLETGFMERKK